MSDLDNQFFSQIEKFSGLHKIIHLDKTGHVIDRSHFLDTAIITLTGNGPREGASVHTCSILLSIDESLSHSLGLSSMYA